MKLFTLSLLACVCLCSGVLRGNTEQFVLSPFDGHQPYLLVHADEEGGSRREPGIYVADRDGNWKLTIAGKVIKGGVSTGILSHLELSKHDHKYGAIVVLNGRLVIFNLDSRQEKKGSYIEIGGADHPLIDLMSYMQVALPEIEHLDSVSIFGLNPSASGQGIIVSIKFKQKSLLGDGVTFGLFLKPGQDGLFGSAQKPLILDYSFWPKTKLSFLKMALQNDSLSSAVVSPLLLHALSQSKSGDVAAIEKWKQDLNKLSKSFESSYLVPVDTNMCQRVPYIDLATGEKKIPQPISEILPISFLAARQIYDPLKGMDGVYFGKKQDIRDFKTSDYALPGRVDIVDHRYAIFPIVDFNAVLISINKELYLVMEGDPYRMIKVHSIDDIDKVKLSKSAVLIDRKDRKELILLLSMKRSTVTQTEVIVFGLVGNVIHEKTRHVFSQTFYGEEDFVERIHNIDGEVLFDNLTAPQNSKAAYNQTAKASMPYLNLTQSQSGRLVQTYLNPLREVSLGKHVVQRDFDPEGALENQSGIFIRKSGNRWERLVSTQLLVKKNAEEETAILASAKTESPDGKGRSLHVDIVAGDQLLRSGESGFVLYAILSSSENGESKEYFKPYSSSLNFHVPFEDLAALYLLPGEKNFKKQLTLVITIDAKSKDAIKNNSVKPGVYYANLKLIPGKNDTEGPYALEMEKLIKLSDKCMSPVELKNRMRKDQEGRRYFVVDKGVDEHHSTYELFDLMSGQAFYPNSKKGKGKKIVSADLEDEGGGGRGFGVRSASWEVWSAYTLMDRFPDLLPKKDETSVSGKKDPKKEKVTPKDADKNELSSEKNIPDLRPAMESLASLEEAPIHKVFLVTKEYKRDLLKAILEMWADEKGTGRARLFWSRKNSKLKLYTLDAEKASTQTEVWENFEAMKKQASTERSVLVADINEVIKAGRCKEEDGAEPFEIHSLEIDEEDGTESVNHVVPHLAYWLGLEGERVELKAISENAISPQVAMALVATPEEWEEVKEAADLEMGAGLGKKFHLDTTFLYGKWKVWPADNIYATEEYVKLRDRAVSDYEKDLFPTLSELLESVSKKNSKPEHHVLIVPEELKGTVQRLVKARWVNADSAKESWSQKNNQLILYELEASNTTKQEEVFDNLKALCSLPADKRGVLLGDLDDIFTASRPPATDASRAFLIQDVRAKSESDILPDKDPDAGVEIEKTLKPPHFLHLLASEGKRLTLKELESHEKNQVSMLFVGTKDEWEAISEDLGPEESILIPSRFEIHELPTPSAEARKRLIHRMLMRPEIRGLGYELDAKRIVSESEKLSVSETSDAVLGYMVRRCELLAKQSGREVIPAFVQFLNAMAVSLVNDEVARRRRAIDRVLVERVLSRVFSMPLNLSLLPQDDPLVRLSQKDAALKMQEAGYEGSLEFKRTVISTLLAQTKNDPVRPIPSSIILFGESGTGKTHLFVTLCRWLGLSLYDYSKPKEAGAQAMIINVAKLTPSSKKTDGNLPAANDISSVSGESMSVDEAIRHFHNFLASPQGYRGFVLFDDVHKAPSEEVRAAILTEIRSLFEAQNGIYRVKVPGNKVVEIPVRNLSVFMSLNPPDDVEKIKRFAKGGNQVIDLIIAALAGSDFQVERSTLERWALILNVSQFPTEAKAPKLRDSVREASKENFNSQNKLVLVAPSTINHIANEFQKENARSFLSRATPGLITKGNEAIENSDNGVVILVPHSELSIRSALNPHHMPKQWEASGSSGTGIEPFIDDKIAALPLKGRLDGQMELLKVMVEAFRVYVYESFVKAALQDISIAGDGQRERELLGPFLHGVVAHLISRPELPLFAIDLDPFDFSLKTELSRKQFRDGLSLLESRFGKKYFPFKFAEEMRHVGILEKLESHQFPGELEGNRAKVLSETRDKLSEPLTEYLAQMLRVENVASLPSQKKWLDQLPTLDVDYPHKNLGKKLTEIMRSMYSELYTPGLTETLRPQDFLELNPYDVVRLFCFAMDKAISRLAWGKVSVFLSRALELSTQNMELGQIPGLQYYLFQSRFTAVGSMSQVFISQIASNSAVFQQWDPEQQVSMAQRFENSCSQYLVQK